MADDKSQIGLTAEGSAALSLLIEQGLFGSEGDGYKFGVAYALGSGLTADPSAKGYTTKFNAAGGLDRDGSLREIVPLLSGDGAERPYATAERLADAGLRDLARRIAQRESLSEILSELTADGGTE